MGGLKTGRVSDFPFFSRWKCSGSIVNGFQRDMTLKILRPDSVQKLKDRFKVSKQLLVGQCFQIFGGVLTTQSCSELTDQSKVLRLIWGTYGDHQGDWWGSLVKKDRLVTPSDVKTGLFDRFRRRTMD